MLVIRLKRIGKKNQAFFRLVLADKKRAVKGKILEDLGFLNPHSKKAEIKKERVKYWLSVGATPSDSAFNLLIKKGITKGPKRKIKFHKKKKEGETPVAPVPAVSETVTPATPPISSESTEKTSPSAK